jgi:metal-responsive CopG/Arc/MetJ family transcriptional regulator
MSTQDAAAPDSSRITVTLPAELVRALDEQLVNGEGNRSTVICCLLEQEPRAHEEGDRSGDQTGEDGVPLA